MARAADSDDCTELLFSGFSSFSAQRFSAFANQIACLDGGGNGAYGDPDDIPYSYDAYGNPTNDGIKTYTYDAENRRSTSVYFRFFLYKLYLALMLLIFAPSFARPAPAAPK